MAAIQSKRSIRKKQSAKQITKLPTHQLTKSPKAAPHKNRGASAANPDRDSSSVERRNQIRSSESARRRSVKPRTKKRTIRKRSSSNKPMPGEFALRERTLPGRRFVEFPLVKGKIAERVQLFTTTNHNSLAIDFQDKTSLYLNIEPGFTIHAQLTRLEKGELETLAEWPPIKNVTERD